MPTTTIRICRLRMLKGRRQCSFRSICRKISRDDAIMSRGTRGKRRVLRSGWRNGEGWKSRNHNNLFPNFSHYNYRTANKQELQARFVMTNKTDSELVALALAGDKDAFGQLIERYQQMVGRIALGVVGHEEI